MIEEGSMEDGEDGSDDSALFAFHPIYQQIIKQQLVHELHTYSTHPSNMRSSIARVARPLASQQLRQFSARAAARPSILAAPSSSLLKSQKVVVAPQWSQMRFASGSSLSKDDIKARVLDVLKSFEKVDPAKVSVTMTKIKIKAVNDGWHCLSSARSSLLCPSC